MPDISNSFPKRHARVCSEVGQAAEPDCGALWLDGRKGSTWGRRHTYSPAVWDAHWRRQNRTFDQSARMAWILERLPLASRSNILDVACGAGLLVLPLARAGHSVTGVDVSAAGIERLNKASRAEGLENLRTIVGDWLRLDFDSLGGPFDLAVVSYGLGAVTPRPFLERMFAVAGTVAVIEPAGPRHWHHPEFWPLLDGQRFEPGPDHTMIEALLRQMGYAPRVDTGVYDTAISFSDFNEAVGWLLGCVGVAPESGLEAAHQYLKPLLRRSGNGFVLEQRQSIAMLTVAP